MGLFGGSKKSTSTSTTNAIDNRMAVTDNALGISSSGSGNDVALAPFSNLKTGGNLSFSSSSRTDNNTSTTINALDGNAIGGAFDFAKKSVSESMGAVLDAQKQGSALAGRGFDFSGSALERAFDFSAMTLSQSLDAVLDAQKQSAAAVARVTDTAASALQKTADATVNAASGGALAINKWVITGGLLLAGLWIWKGAK